MGGGGDKQRSTEKRKSKQKDFTKQWFVIIW